MTTRKKDKGFIALYRELSDHWLWDDTPFARGQAWVDLLLMANHKDNKTIFNGNPIEVKRGQMITSIQKLCTRWGWSNSKVNKFLETLEKERMLTRKSDAKKTVITIDNYAFWQSTEDEKHHRNDTEAYQKHNRSISETYQKHIRNTQTTTINNENNENNVNKLCTELESSSMQNTNAEKENSFIDLILNDKSLFFVNDKDIAEWKKLYPAVDVKQELRNMKGWLDANPTKRKTRRGIKRFINNWLTRSQDKGGTRPNALKQNRKSFRTAAQQIEQKQVDDEVMAMSLERIKEMAEMAGAEDE